MLGSHCWPQARLGAVRGKKRAAGANPQGGLLQTGGSESSPSPTPTATPAGLCFRWLLAPQKPPRVGEHWTDYAGTGSSNTCVSETFRREGTQFSCFSFLRNKEMQWTSRWNTALAHIPGTSSDPCHKTTRNRLSHRVPLWRKHSLLKLHTFARVSPQSPRLKHMLKFFSTQGSQLNLAPVASMMIKLEWHEQIP